MALTRVNGNLITSGTITGSLFGAATITGDKIGLTAITSNLIAANAITGDKIGLTSITSNLISSAITLTNVSVASVSTFLGQIVERANVTSSMSATLTVP